MARLATVGFESQRLTTAATTTGERQGIAGVAVGTVSIATSNQRTGTACASMAQNAANYVTFTSIPAALGRFYYVRGYYRFSDATPSAAATIMTVVANAIDVVTVKLSTGGKLQLFESNGTQVGSDHPTVLADATYYRVELGFAISSAGNAGSAALLVNGVLGPVSLANLDLNNSVTTPSIRLGNISGGQAGVTTLLDDIAINDNVGATSQATYPGVGGVLLAKPVSDSAVGNWEAPQTTGSDTTNIYDAVDNIPPAGVAHSDVDANNLKYIFNANSTVPSSYDANVQSYTAAGLPTGGRVKAVLATGRYSTDSLTGTNDGQIEGVSNPAIAATTISFEEAGAVAGADATQGWLTRSGTVSADPSVTAGTQPVVRVTKSTSSTRANMVDLLGLTFDYDVPIRPTLTPATETGAGQALSVVKPKHLGVTAASETGAAQALSVTHVKRVTVAAAAETGAAQALVHVKRRALVTAAETGAAQALRAARRRTLAVAAETGAAQALLHTKKRNLLAASESGAARALSSAKRRSLAVAGETDGAGALAFHRAAALSAAAETGTAQALVRIKRPSLGTASEADAAQALVHVKPKALGAATETDAAQTLSVSQPSSYTLDTAAESDAALGLSVTHVHYRSAGTATESDEAQALGVAHLHYRALGAATEADSAAPLDATKPIYVTLGAAVESDEAGLLEVSGPHVRDLEATGESDVAEPLTATKTIYAALGAATEESSASGLVARKRAHIAPTGTTDASAALTFIHPHRLVLAPAFEHDQARALLIGHFLIRAITRATEADAARALVVRKTAALTVAEEVDVTPPMGFALAAHEGVTGHVERGVRGFLDDSHDGHLDHELAGRT